jgi:uncharacterized membrane protein YraQ (UPF0718 family)
MPPKSEHSAKKPAETSATTDPPRDPAAALATTAARVRWLMIISALTTAIAIAAVVGVIGYRVFNRGESSTATIVNGTVFLPKGAHVDSTTISDGRIVVTYDVAGSTAVRFFDLKTLQLIGELNFATQQ